MKMEKLMPVTDRQRLPLLELLTEPTNRINWQYMHRINGQFKGIEYNLNGPTYRSISLDGALDIVSSVLRFSETEDTEWVVVTENSETRKFDLTFILNPDIMFSEYYYLIILAWNEYLIWILLNIKPLQRKCFLAAASVGLDWAQLAPSSGLETSKIKLKENHYHRFWPLMTTPGSWYRMLGDWRLESQGFVGPCCQIGNIGSGGISISSNQSLVWTLSVSFIVAFVALLRPDLWPGPWHIYTLLTLTQ